MLDIITENWPLFLTALRQTLLMSLIAFVLAFVVGLVVASFRVSPVPPLKRLATIYTEFFRNMPLLVLVVLVFYVLPDIGFPLSRFATGVAALTLYTGAYMAEAIRSGINAVDRGEVEAARAVGMRFSQVLSLIVLPQALRTVVAPIANLFIAHTKNTTVTIVASANELGDLVRRLGSATANYFTVALIVAIMFVIVLIPIGYLFGILERKVAIKR